MNVPPPTPSLHVEVVRADAADPDAVAALARGAAALYHCINTRYSAAAWNTELPAIQAGLVEGARRTGARLVVLDNLYSLGRPDAPMTEETKPAPRSKKGEARLRLEASLSAARRAGVRVVAGRASDFYGPGGAQTQFEGHFWSKALAGKPGPLFFDPTTPHTYHYLADVARGLAALGEAADATLGSDGSFMLPCHPAEPTTALVARFAAALGRPIRIQRPPALVRAGLGLFVPLLREVNEMLYQWDGPFVVDDRRFRARFGLEPTPLDEAARATVSWAREAYGPHRAG